MSNSRTLKFYNFKIFKSVVASSKDAKLKPEEVKTVFDKFIKQQTKISNALFAPVGTTQFPNSKNTSKIFFDVITNDDNFLFASIGQESSTNIQIRNIEDLKPRQIERLQDEIFESHTYFILDYKNLFISYFSNQGAPSIKNLENLFNNFDVSKGHKISGFTEFHIHTETISDHDTLTSLFSGEKEKELVDLSINLATPQADILGRMVPGLKRYESMVDNGMKLDAKIVISKPKSDDKKKSLGTVKENKSLLESVKKAVSISRKTDGKSNATLRTKVEGYRIQSQQLFDDVFTFTIPFNLTDKKIKDRLEILSKKDGKDYTSVKHAQLAINNIIFDEMKIGYLEVQSELRRLSRL
ncbi:hypothetical protein U5N25_03490 [Exiguobacterium indicum]|uniref:hypothetical protein n=1 Tax=Exiguobacterium indicum TaxID=296995 RepID=UPI00397C4455